MSKEVLVAFKNDCEATQPAIADRALGERAAFGHAEVLEQNGLIGTYYCIPSEAKQNAHVYKELKSRGHEIGLHVHPADHGYEEFLGVYGAEEQHDILNEATGIFEDAMGFRPESVCLGYGSSNDHTRGVLVDLGYRQGLTMIPGRILPQCASVGAGAPQDPYYGHRYNRLLRGDLDFVECPPTTDQDSRMWGGAHPQDLRVELVDAKNHYYVIRKTLERQMAMDDLPFLYVCCVTHNIFEFGKEGDFRRDTLIGIIGHMKRLIEEFGLTLRPANIRQVAETYRERVPLPESGQKLALDRRGY